MEQADIARVARLLTSAQKYYLTTAVEWRQPAPCAAKRWMTSPPSATHRVLCALGLTDRSGQILELGLAVRNHLTPKGQPHADR